MVWRVSAVADPPAEADAAPVALAPRRHRFLLVLLFVEGAATLGAEIAAIRLLAPFFGASTIVWANTIAVVLVALSLGYWYGGRRADRTPTLEALARWLLIPAAILTVLPFVAQPFLGLSVAAFDRIDVGAAAGSLFAVLALVALPVFMLAAASPWAIRIAVPSIAQAGGTVGRMYAISTVGSLCGTFLSALLLVPLVGTQRTFVLFALAVAAVAVLVLPRRFLVVPALIAAALALPPGATKATADVRLLEERETEQQYARVVELPDGERRLELNEGQAFHSTWRADTVLTGNVWDGYLSTPVSVLGRAPESVLILGNGGGTTMRAYERFFPRTEIDGVEIDGELSELGRRWLGLRDRPGVRLHTADARPFLRRAERRWEAIMVDAYRQPYIPFYLTTEEFFAEVRRHLEPGGVVIVNAGHPEDATELEEVLAAGLATAFPHVAWDRITRFNTLLVAADRPPSAERLRAFAAGADPELADVLEGTAARLEPADPAGRSAFTDDRAPVEWLIDRSIVSYAAG
jgi:predicted membrane-bound spermidine synthase